ncbi:MAG: filamentous hemagglutinin N-terminal domain-containing protein [Spirirestis rafaelensis WJT71-NPBG6]|nr:filamentous hemagglutinin N-terminal domain-containing protein [Spirirestis rafaelensis WJT71-NPBG6]
MSTRWNWFLGIASWCAFGFAVSQTFALECNCAFAQSNILPDNTLGTQSSVVTPNVDINGIKSDRISGGAIRGANLFHSFQEFNIDEGRGAYFTNPAGIENILSRVTGGNASNILGKLGVLGNANLFLINPSGIIFGKNASLDVRGSFVGTTASSLNFADGTKFSATVSETTPLLTVSVPLGLQLGTNNSGTIANAGNLAVGENLTLAAGNLDIQGQMQAGGNLTLQALDTVRLRDSVENPLIAKASDQLIVQGNQAIDIFALNNLASGLFSGGDMVLRSANTVAGDAHYTTGGNFRIEQLDGNLGSLFSPYDPIIRASGDVTFDNYRGPSLHILAGGSVSIPGNVRITGRDTQANSIIENLRLSDGTTVVPINGNAQSTVDIRAGTTAFGITGIIGRNTGFSSEIFNTSDAATSADISIGSITNTNRRGVVFLTNQYKANTSLAGGAIKVGAIDTYVSDGNAGSVIIDSRGSIKLTGALRASSRNGNGGAVTLQARNDITTNDNISTLITDGGVGNGGNISLTSTQGAINTTFIRDGGVGNGGNISLTSTQGAINTTAGKLNAGNSGNGGAITLNGYNDITTGNLSSYVETDGKGNGGDISLTSTQGAIDTTSGLIGSYSDFDGTAGNVTLNAAGNITPGNIQSGPGGDINFISNADVYLANNGISSITRGDRKGGDINITARSLVATKGTELITSTYGEGNAGNVIINARDRVSLDGGQEVITTGKFISTKLYSRVESNAGGQGGQIHIKTGSLSVTNGAFLSTSTDGKINANAGSVIIDARNSASFDGVGPDRTPSGANSNVLQDAKGQAGSVIINVPAGLVSVTNGAQLSARTFLRSTGKGGDVRITTGQLSVRDNAEVTVNSNGSGDAGSLTVNANSINLDNSGKIRASTASGEGGNIDLRVRDLITMRRQSQISAEAGNNGNGGNIRINSPDGFIVAVPKENSDIIAKAFRGRGGNINITTSGIYGLLEYRPELPPEISDINVSSQFGVNGTVTINTPDVDPNRGLVNLPAVPLDTEVSQICQPRTAENQSSFTIIGRGGLPPNPRTEPLSGDAVQVDWVTLKPRTENRSSPEVTNNPTPATPAAIVEAQGWVRNAKGEVVLTANAPTATPHNFWQTPAFCHGD